MTVEHIAGRNGESIAVSEAIRAGDFVFLSGLAGLGPDGEIVSGGVAAETDRIMLEIKDILQRAGLRLADIIKINAYLEDAGDAVNFNAAYAKYFPGLKPARTSFVARLLSGGRLEVDVVAYGPKAAPG